MTRDHPHYPVFLDIEGRDIVVVGGGAVSERKIGALLRCGARVVVVAPEVTPRIESWAADGRLTLRRKRYDATDIDGSMIAVASTSDAAVNARVATDARERNVLVNVADNQKLCDFIVPAVIESGSMQVAVSTGGSSPALARRLKADLQRALGNEYAEVNTILGSLRDGAKVALPHDSDRKRFFDEIIAAGVVDLLRAGQRQEAYRAVAEVCRLAGVPVSPRVAQELARP